MNQKQNPELVVKIIWFALLMQPAVFFYISNFSMPIPETAPENASLVTTVFISIAFLEAFIAYMVRSKAIKIRDDFSSRANHNDSSGALAKILPLLIISWALCESIAILGFVSVVTFGQMEVGNGLMLTGALLISFFRPIGIESNTLRRSYTNENRE